MSLPPLYSLALWIAESGDGSWTSAYVPDGYVWIVRDICVNQAAPGLIDAGYFALEETEYGIGIAGAIWQPGTNANWFMQSGRSAVLRYGSGLSAQTPALNTQIYVSGYQLTTA